MIQCFCQVRAVFGRFGYIKLQKYCFFSEIIEDSEIFFDLTYINRLRHHQPIANRRGFLHDHPLCRKR